VAIGLVAALLTGLVHTHHADAAVGRAGLDGSGVDQTFIEQPDGSITWDVAVDASHVYWTSDAPNDPAGASIGRSNLDGTAVDPNFITGLSGPRGIAVSDGHIYWANFGTASIGRANLDGTGASSSFIPNVSRPFDVEVGAGYVFWARSSEPEGAPAEARVGRAKLDGTEVNPDLIGPVFLGSSRVLAVGAEHVYWLGEGGVGRAKVDGTGIDRDFLESSPFDVAVDATRIYFSGVFPDGRDAVAAIGRTTLDSPSPDPFGFLTDLNTPRGLAVDAQHIYWAGEEAPRIRPRAHFTKDAPKKTKKHRVRFRFTSTPPAVGFECRLDNKEFKPCSSPKTVRGLDAGTHRFWVRALGAEQITGPATRDKFKVLP
jgi:virginiamycin B lyase